MALAIRASRVFAVLRIPSTATGVSGRNPINKRVVTAATEDSTRRELAVLGRGASNGKGAGRADGALEARTASDNALSARRELPLAHPSVSLLAAACAAAARMKVASEEPSHNTPKSSDERTDKLTACSMPCSWQQARNSRPVAGSRFNEVMKQTHIDCHYVYVGSMPIVCLPRGQKAQCIQQVYEKSYLHH